MENFNIELMLSNSHLLTNKCTVITLKMKERISHIKMLPAVTLNKSLWHPSHQYKSRPLQNVYISLEIHIQSKCLDLTILLDDNDLDETWWLVEITHTPKTKCELLRWEPITSEAKIFPSKLRLTALRHRTSGINLKSYCSGRVKFRSFWIKQKYFNFCIIIEGEK